MNYVYDLETLSNCFTAVFEDSEGADTREFVIHESRNDAVKLNEFLHELKSSRGGLIGFNNKHFDWPILAYFQAIVSSYWNKPEVMVRMLYGKAQAIISDEKKTYAEEYIPQLDLYLINHYDNKNRSTSLKALQVSIKWANVMDMPIHHSSTISEAQIPEILKYNRNDVSSTKAFYKLCTDKIELRKKLGSKFKQRFLNRSDVSIGEIIFVKYLAEKMGISMKEVRMRRSRFCEVPLKNIIFPYIKFRTPQFQELHTKFLTTTMGKSVYDELNERLGSLEEKTTDSFQQVLNGMNLKARQEPESKKKKSFSYSARFGGLMFDYGIGGVHACTWPGVYSSDEKYVMVDIDGKSYYPNLSIRNRLRPRHFPEVFCDVYEDIYNQRIEAQNTKDSIMSDGLKLSLNGIFGKTLDINSCFYDPYFFAGITVNGQLLMSMLAESAVLDADAELIQVNTDGITVRILRSNMPALDKVCKQWEAVTNIVLETKEYDRMAIRDVNNYIGFFTDGKVKEKGVFETVKEWHKDPSFMIVPIAVSEYFKKGTPLMDTLSSHKDLYDFCGRYKATPGFTATFVYLDKDREKRDSYGKIMRYIPVKKGGTAMKIHRDGREINLLEGWPTQVFNDYFEMDRKNIELRYFETECQKLIQSVQTPQMNLL